MKSMTGFGRGEISVDGVRFRVEISSVNRKQIDVVVNLSRDLVELDIPLRKTIAETVSRGRVVVSVTVEQLRATAQNLRVDDALADQYHAAAVRLVKKHKLAAGVTAADILRSPGVVSLSDHPVEAASAWPHIQEALNRSITAFNKSRAREGNHLKKDMMARLRTLRGLLKSIAKEAATVAAYHRANLHRRLEESGLPLPLDDERLLKEIGFFAERCDISEEITRLECHFEQFQNYLNSTEPQGRAMDFLSQELNREFNTIGSKANKAGIAQLVVTGKSEVEKIREQVQNVE
ncbi:MAG: YicC/YloC family endoribonuclease [Verrucomicrobiales bacterium]